MALASSDEVRAYSEIIAYTPTNLIEELLKSVSSKIDSYCNRTLESTTHTEYLDGFNNEILYPKNYPITSVSGIWEDLSRLWSDSTLVNSSYYFIDSNSIVRSTGTFMEGKKVIKITYTAGYQSTAIPNDLKQVCISEVSREFKRRKDPAVISKTSDDTTITYNTDDILPENKIVLRAYRRIV